jgi:8-oxo-dGTP pyrophosphatase MutT (NUDIX family)
VYALSIIRHPDGRFCVVEETGKRGWWIAGGAVELGETLQEAAVREAKEEAGIAIRLDGVLRVENSIFGSNLRLRAIFLATPVDPTAPLKSVPDSESLRAEWKTAAEIEALGKRLRSDEPLVWARYLEGGGPVYPLSVLTEEGEPIPAATA